MIAKNNKFLPFKINITHHDQHPLAKEKKNRSERWRYCKTAGLGLVWLTVVIVWLIGFDHSKSQVTKSNINVNKTKSEHFYDSKIENGNHLKLEYIADDPNPFGTNGLIFGALILVFMYILIMFEIVHRTIAAILASTLAVATMGALGNRPSMTKVALFIDAETLFLLFSMMLLVALIVPTGLFDYSAVFAFKLTHGRTWPLIGYLTLFTAVMSALLDNVTTILLMGSVVIRICVVAEIAPQPVMLMVIFSGNLGGMATPIGDPPNIMIINNKYFIDNVRIKFFCRRIIIDFFLSGIKFSKFLLSHGNWGSVGYRRGFFAVTFLSLQRS